VYRRPRGHFQLAWWGAGLVGFSPGGKQRTTALRGRRDGLKRPYYCRKSPSRTRDGLNGERVSRNDPCPCDSGLKFKKCCYRKAPAITHLDRTMAIEVLEKYVET